jgi:serine/threonine protein kinase
MSSSGPDDPTPPASPPPPTGLDGLDPQSLLQTALDTQAFDASAATIPVAGPRPTLAGNHAVDLPLPGELSALLPPGAYQVESFLGQGGMGAVYKGTQVRLKRSVAIKIMRRDLGKDYDFEVRFEREAQAMAKLNHPGIVSVIDYGEAGPDYLYIVMELVDGADLMDVIRSGGMTQEMALSLLPQICDALQFAHDHGIVHRDIKPSNIMLTRDGRIKMADFGLAKHFDAENSFRTQTGTGMGTPDYAAPEQFDPTTQIDHRADIYALGVMIYQMITGQLPRGVWKPPSQRAAVDPHWDDIVFRAMQNDPADRYQQASQVKTDVSSIPLIAGRAAAPSAAASGPAETSSPKPGALGQSALPKTKSRAPLLIGAVAVLAITLFFALKQPDPGRTDGPPSAAKASAVPNSSSAAIGGQSALPNAIPPLPESGWQPLFTETEWHLPYKTTRKQADGSTVPAGRSFENGLLHVQNFSYVKPQPATDAAIRARIVIQPGSDTLAVVARRSGADGFYKWGTTSNDRLLSLIHFKSGTNTSTTLGKHELSAPLRAGDKLALELRVQGNRLTALANGAVVIDVQDDRLKAAGECGIDAHNAWFESCEVQAPPAAVSPSPSLPVSESWQNALADSTKLILSGGAQITKDGLLLTGESSRAVVLGGKTRDDCAIRMRSTLDGLHLGLRARNHEGGSHYNLDIPGKTTIKLQRWDNVARQSTVLREFPLPTGFDLNAEHEMELRVEGSTLTVSLDRHRLGTATDGVFKSGSFGVAVGESIAKPVIITSLEVLELEDAADSPSPNLPVSKSSSLYPPGQWVKLFTKPEDLPSDLRQPESGVKWEDEAMRLDRKGIRPPKLQARDGILRASVRMNANAKNPNLWLRAAPVGINQAYELGVDAAQSKVFLRLVADDRKGHDLRVWTLPRTYTGEEWLKVELKVVSDKLTVSVDGAELGAVQDSTLKDAGAVQIYAQEKGYFRDIEFINLDGLSEAEMLRLLGVDAQGNDLRGKSDATPSTEAWQNLLNGPNALRLSAAKFTSRGMEIDGVGGATTRKFYRDGAVRMAIVLDPSKKLLQLRARRRDDGSAYVANVVDGSSLAVIQMDENGAGNHHVFNAPLKPALQPGQRYELEFRCVGPLFTVRINGKVIGQFNNDAIGEGAFGIGSIDDLPVVVETFELLDLDKPTTSDLSTELWQNLLNKSSKLTLTGDVRRTAEGLILTASSSVRAQPVAGMPLRDGAVRVRMRVDPGGVRPQLHVREKDSHHYWFHAYNENAFGLGMWVGGTQTDVKLANFTISPPLQIGQECEMELRVTGSTITARLNGKLLGTVTDDTLKEGLFGVGAFRQEGSETLIQSFEILNLDGPSRSPGSSVP